MKKNSLTLSLPEWIDDFLKQYQFPLVSNEERMRFVLKLTCLLYTSPSPRDKRQSRMPSSA